MPSVDDLHDMQCCPEVVKVLEVPTIEREENPLEVDSFSKMPSIGPARSAEVTGEDHIVTLR